jgi:putative ABC transport system permease protein
MSMFLHELRQVLRGIVARPGFSALVVGVLGAGLGCVIFMLALLDGFAIRPLPFAHPEALYQAYLAHGDLGAYERVSGQDLLQIRAHLADVADVAGATRGMVNLNDLDRPEYYSGGHVSANLFGVLGVKPILGRDFVATDEQPGAPAVVMISYTLWQVRYGGDPGVIGRSVRIDANPATVIGVMPRDFSFPRQEMLWVASTLATAAKADQYRYWAVLRRQALVTQAQVESAFQSWFDDASKAQPDLFQDLRPLVEPLANMVLDRTTRLTLGMKLAAVFMVLLIACANAANLMLTRLLGRSQELAIRVALGAGRRRLIVHLFAQNLILSLGGFGVALVLAQFALRWQAMTTLESEHSFLWLHFDIDATVLALALGAALFTACVSGVLPALHAARATPADGLRNAGTRTAGSQIFARASRVLVVGEIALSCALVLCVGTLILGIRANERTDLGIDTAHLVTARVLPPTRAYPTGSEQLRLYERVRERLLAEGDVQAASLGTALPGTNANEVHDVLPDGQTPAPGDLPSTAYAAVDDGFLAAFGVTLQEGRFFDARDRADSARVAVVDRDFADRHGGGDGRSVIGRQFRLDPRDPAGVTVTVIGVVAPLVLYGPGEVPQPSMLMPLRQAPSRVANIAVRTRGDALAFAPRLAQIMREVDADTPLYWLRDYAEIWRHENYRERVTAQSFGAFGAIALLLAGAGLYGVMAFAVGQRTREIGVRRALGAKPWRVLRSVFARNVAQLGVGLGIGLVVGLGLSYQLSQSLGTIAPGGVAVALVAVGVLSLAAVLAALVPAARALRVDPIEALRHQ